MQISKIFHGPVEREFKAPYVLSALVFKDIVGFCFSDFCQRVVQRYKADKVVCLMPEYIFSKIIAFRITKAQRAFSRKIALDLMLYMNAPYRPWFINDFDPVHLEQLNSMGIDTASQAYAMQREIIQPYFNHPYAALAFAVHSESGIKAGQFGNFDACGIAKSLTLIIRNHAEYKHAKRLQLFDHDVFLMQWLELLDYALGGHEMPGHKTALSSFVVQLHNIVENKSRLLLYKTYAAFAKPDEMTWLHSFSSAPNYSVQQNYTLPYCIEVLTHAKDRSNWKLFDYVLNQFCDERTRKNRVVQHLCIAAAKNKAAKSAVFSGGNANAVPRGYQSELAGGLDLGNQIAKAFQVAEAPKYCRSSHAHSPDYFYGVYLKDLQTELLIQLLGFAYAVADGGVKKQTGCTELILTPKLLDLIYPNRCDAWQLISMLLSARILKLDKEFFNALWIRKLDDWHSYMGAKVTLNVLDLFSLNSVSIRTINTEIKNRKDLPDAVRRLWVKLVDSFFYAELAQLIQAADCDALKKYEVPTAIKVKLKKSGLSAMDLCHVAKEAVSNTLELSCAAESLVQKVGVHGLSGKTLLSYNLQRYLEQAIVCGVDSPAAPYAALKQYGMTEALGDICGYSRDTLISRSPHTFKLMVRGLRI